MDLDGMGVGEDFGGLGGGEIIIRKYGMKNMFL